LPSARKRAAGEKTLPIYSETIFIDRSLGAEIVAGGLRAAGLTVVTMREYYGEAEGQRKADVDWIADVGAEDWVAFHADSNIRHRLDELAAVDAAALRSFVIPNASITGQASLQRYLTNLARISRAARQPGPYIYGVYESRIDKLHPVPPRS
jgi:hypothetical protein